jgi:hypothetical protein
MAKPARIAARLAVIGAAGVLLVAPAPARGYEFEIHSYTLGQGYQLRAYRPLTGDTILRRRRFTQTLTLNIWNIGLGQAPLAHDSRIDRRPRVSVAAFFRLDHDYGDYTTGQVAISSNLFDAVDLIPELASASLNLDVLYATVSAEDLAGAVDVELGRHLVVDALDWWSFDGVSARVRTPWRFAAQGFAGLRIRDTSPGGSVGHELDGTGSGECAEYVEGATPGSGAWRPIDRAVIDGGNPFVSEFAVCPQRDQLMPTFGGALETSDGPLHARLTYRRSVSRTPGLIGEVDRFEFPDRGLYPNELGQAPRWGTNEELLALAARYVHPLAGRGQLVPYAAVRYSALHGVIDELHGGVRLAYGAHSFTPEYYRTLATFDGDSIFNVFSVQPYDDARVTYQVRPRGVLSGYARGWLRRFASEDGGPGVDRSRLAGGLHLGGQYRPGPWSYTRLDLFQEGGYGGHRLGGFASSRWRVRRDWDVAARVSAVYLNQDLLAELKGTSLGSQLGATYQIAPGIALHVVAEENLNRFRDGQFRLIGMLDLAFHPDT